MKPRQPKVFRPDEEAQLTGSGLRIPPRWPRRARRVLVARPLMVYRYIDLEGVPRTRRAAAVHAQLKAWSPFGEGDEDNTYRVWEFARGAGVFAWDAARMRERLRAGGGAAVQRRLELVPETAFVAPPPSGQGLRLIRGIEGFEAQQWRGGSLVATRAFEQRPDEAEWTNFQRGVGVAAQDMRTLSQAQVERTPWAEPPARSLTSPEALEGRARLRERAAVMVTSLALMFATAWVARQHWDILQHRHRLTEELSRSEHAAQANREVRDRALALRQQVDTLAKALSRPSPLVVLDHLMTHLPATGTEIQDLTLDGSELHVVLKTPAGVGREALVKSLESGGLLGDVREARDSTPAAVALTMKVLAPPSPAGAGAARP
jgi:hypothetical protein